ncbi:MAG TPA: ATP-binding protein [Solirubrobacteraceae bacterium]|nr:ATP-binding protein [Solirubrobacteraceae bacterium]
MRAPIAFVYGNCVFAQGPDDGWAAFAVGVSSYAWLSEEGKRAPFLALIGALEAIEADVQILRVGRRWPVERYVEEASGEGGSARSSPDVHVRARRRYVNEHLRRLTEIGAVQPAVFLLVSLRDPERDVASYVSRAAAQHPREWWEGVRRAVSVRDRRLLKASGLERARVRADQAHARLADLLPVRQVRGVELQWLVRRAFCRGLGEPLVDGLHEPRALVFERNGEAVLAPLEGDVMRWMDGYVEHRGRALRIESELGTSWQAQLVVGALPERMQFPGARAELMFAPAESLPFPIDLSLNARFLPNALALRIARRRIQDADQILRAESDGEQGVSDLGYERTQEARDLLAYLQASSRPPLLRATLAIAVGAADEEELEQRVEMCRRAYGEIRLHRPLGDQLQLFLQHLPGQRTRVAGYDDTLTTEQVAAMMPTAVHLAGSSTGFYLGHTLSGSRQPVRFNLREGSDSDRNATILSVGALGSGKTTLAQKLKYEGFLQGARVIDCDPKGDHRFHLLEEVAPHAECVTLRPDPALRGVLDPLRVAPAHLRQDAAVSFLRDLLPGRAEPAWETAVVGAVDRVMTRSREPTCLEVVRALSEGDETDAQVGKTLEVYARSGLTQLGFADPRVKLPPVGSRQVTYLPIRDLPGPQPGTRRSEYSQSERVGEQIVRLIAMFAMHLLGAERERLKLFCFDEGWRLLGDPVGRTLLGSLQRMGRSELAVPIISTQLVTDALIGERESLENLIGATFVFGMRSEAEAGRALALLGLDPEDRRMRQTLLGLEAGRCLFRDHSGRVEAIQVDVVVPSLLRAFSTTPRPG